MKKLKFMLLAAAVITAHLLTACDNDSESEKDTAVSTDNINGTDSSTGLGTDSGGLNDTGSVVDSATATASDSGGELADTNVTDTNSDTVTGSDTDTVVVDTATATGSDTTVDTALDTASDSLTDTGSDTVEVVCGGEGDACCNETDGCDEGLDAYVMAIYNNMCLCVTDCAYTECTAGTLPGYCAPFYQVEGYGCVNATDFPDDRTSNDCTPGEVCTTDSGDANGICKELPDPTGGADDTFIRCVVACDTPPSACATEGLVCSPDYIPRADGTIEVDYSYAHCFPAY